MTVRQLLASIDSAELTEWMAFERLEPFGALPDEMRLGMVTATVANVNRNPDTKPDPYRPSDFMTALQAEIERYEQALAPPVSTDPKARSAVLAAMLFGRIRE